MSADPISPLLFHQGALGDTVQLTAMLQALAARWGAPCDLVTGSAPRALIDGLDCVGEVHRLGSRSMPFWASARQRRLVAWLRRRAPSPCWVVERWRHPVAPWSRRTRMEWLLDRGGVPARRRVSCEDLPRGPLEHAVDYQLRLAALDPPAWAGAAAGVTAADFRPRLAVSAEEFADCRRWLEGRGWHGEPLLLLQANARRRKRGRWPDANWRRLVAAIRAERPATWIALLGSPAERKQTAALATQLAPWRVHDLAAELPLRRLLALLAIADSLISLDSGPAHAAAALDCPVVVLQGTADPRRNRPIGGLGAVEIVTAYGDRLPDTAEEWFRRHDPAAIPVDRVFDAWRRLPAPSRGADARRRSESRS